MKETSKRVVLTDEKIDDIIDMLENIIKALKDVKSHKTSFASSCKTRNLDWMKVRRCLLSINKCSITDVAPLELSEEEVFDNYEMLYSKVFGESSLQDILPFDYIETVEYVLNNTLQDRETRIIRMRFGLTEDETPLKPREIAEKENVSVARADQIVRTILCKLRHPSRSRILKNGVSRYKLENGESQKAHYDKLAQQEIKFLKQTESELREQLKSQKEKIVALNKIVLEQGGKNRKSFLEPLEEDIEKLDLTVRAYNVLRRSGIKTIEETLALTRYELSRLRNMGASAESDVVEKLDKYLQDNCNMSLEDYHNTFHKENAQAYLDKNYVEIKY